MAKTLSKRKPLHPHEESTEQRRRRAQKILEALIGEFPRPVTALLHENPFQLLVATILSAQCTDERVNRVTPALFRKYPDAASLAAAPQTELEQEIRSTGFYHNKAKSLIACSKALVERHNGKVPDAMDALVTLPGVGRKTANVVLGQAFGKTSGVVVDTHVQRLAQRMGFTRANQAERIEQDLMEIFPEKDWIDVGSVLILHGRRTCSARKPDCPSCAVRALCPSAELFVFAPRRE
jgi:endonuclease-3